jgi:uncharacterized protein YcbX
MKSARAIGRSCARVGPAGLEWDRHWMGVDARGTFLTQRTHPRLALIEPEIRAEHLVLNACGEPPLPVPLAPAGEPIEVRVWKHSGPALDAGEEAARWLSRVLKAPARLVGLAPQMDRVADRTYTGSLSAPLAFADGFPILVCNQASLEVVNERLPAEVPMGRFRPNLVLSGLPAFAEDRIDTLRIGQITLRLVKPCTRCVIPAIDQRTGERGADPTPVLRELRFDPVLRGVTFGENAVVSAGVGALLTRGSDCVVTLEGNAP